jgi:hypothetical protein
VASILKAKLYACYLPHARFLLCLFFDPEDEETYFFETSVDFQLTKRRYIPEDRTVHYSSGSY